MSAIRLTDAAGNLVAVRTRDTTPKLLIADDSTAALLQAIVMMLGKIRRQLEEGK